MEIRVNDDNHQLSAPNLETDNDLQSGSHLARFKNPGTLAVFLFFAVACAFLPAIKNDFIGYDDPAIITSNPLAQQGWTAAGLKWALTENVLGNWQPVANLSHLTDCAIFGLRPWGHHLTNVILHAMNAALLFLFLQRTTGALWRSFFAAALFGFHPMRVESVAWVAERKDVLCASFFILTLISYAKFARAREKLESTAAAFYFCALLTFALGLMSKSMLVTVPFLLLLMDYWPLNRCKPGASVRLLLEKLPFLALALAMCVITVRMQTGRGAVMSAASFTASQRVNNALVSYWRYIAKTIWPDPLAIPYPFPKNEWPDSLAIACALGLLLVATVVVASRRSRPYLPVGWFWFLGMMVPVIGLVQVGMQSMADRYTYLPGIGLSILASWGAGDFALRFARGRNLLLAASAAAVLLACFALTQRQLGFWSTSETLFQHTIAVTSDNAVAYSMLADALTAKGDDDHAAICYQNALALRPHLAGAHRNYGLLLQRQGQITNAAQQFQLAEADAPATDAASENDLGVMLGEVGNLDDAERSFRRALQLNPSDASAWANIGQLDLKRGATNKAIADYQNALQLDPQSTIAQDQLKKLRP